MRKLINTTIGLFCTVLAVFPILVLINGQGIEMGQTSECGVITYMADPSVPHFHKSVARIEVEPIFVIEFKDRVEEIKPTWGDFLKHNVGDTVCYQKSTFFTKLGIILSLIGGAFAIAYLFTLLVLMVDWLGKED